MKLKIVIAIISLLWAFGWGFFYGTNHYKVEAFERDNYSFSLILEYFHVVAFSAWLLMNAIIIGAVVFGSMNTLWRLVSATLNL